MYSTAASASYHLTVTSPNQDGSGNFFLDSTSGLGSIPYDLYFTDAGNGPGTMKVGTTSISGTGDANNQFCQGTSNATLSVNVAEQSLQRAKSGSYHDTLTILVVPQ